MRISCINLCFLESRLHIVVLCDGNEIAEFWKAFNEGDERFLFFLTKYLEKRKLVQYHSEG